MTTWRLKLKWVNGQAFANYEDWECHLNGFHRVPFRESDVPLAAAILRDDDRLLSESRKVLKQWPITAAVHLSIPTLNKKAWMGHAACFLGCGASDRASVAAYWSLTENGRDSANAVVWKVYEEWLSSVQKPDESFQDLSGQLVFPFLMQQSSE